MTTTKLSTSSPDYSEAFVRIQHLHRDMQKSLQARDYVESRALARAIALEAMHIGIWCRQFIDDDQTGKEFQ